MNQGEGIISKPSKYSVPETLHRLETILESKNVKVFAVVDHSGEAEKAGLKMPPTQLLIFGNPKGGTPVMLAAPTAAIDLPLKALAWEDASGKVLQKADPAIACPQCGRATDGPTPRSVAAGAARGSALDEAPHDGKTMISVKNQAPQIILSLFK